MRSNVPFRSYFYRSSKELAIFLTLAVVSYLAIACLVHPPRSTAGLPCGKNLDCSSGMQCYQDGKFTICLVDAGGRPLATEQSSVPDKVAPKPEKRPVPEKKVVPEPAPKEVTPEPKAELVVESTPDASTPEATAETSTGDGTSTGEQGQTE